MTLDELQAVTAELGMPRFVARQIADWIYAKRVASFADMANISRKNRQLLEEKYEVGRCEPVRRQTSSDGTEKFLFDIGSRNVIESVYIPDKDRATLCVSSQAGCRMNCYFCATGRGGFKANLSAADIMNQILEIPPEGEGKTPLTNVVFMGMGEPLDNIAPVLKVIEILTAPWGFDWSPKRITVSTVGKQKELKTLLEKTKVHIAVSVHTADPAQRASMMPAQKAYPIEGVIHQLSAYDFSHQRRLSLEYIMWRNLNDDIAHAKKLADLIGTLSARVNLIRFHAIPGVDLHPSSEEKMVTFRNYLNSRGIISTIRASRGEDIDAACGQLAGRRREENR